jgi:hypothetical protein
MFLIVLFGIKAKLRRILAIKKISWKNMYAKAAALFSYVNNTAPTTA